MRKTISPTQPISTITTSVVAEVDSAQTLRSVAEELVADEVGMVLVRCAGRPAGLISERDLVTVLAAGGDPLSTRAADAMATNLVTVPATASIVEVGTRMLDAGIRHVVLKDRDQVVGVVSIRDVLRAMLSQWSPLLTEYTPSKRSSPRPPPMQPRLSPVGVADRS